QILWSTLDPECGWRISCATSGDGTNLCRSRAIRSDRGTGRRDGERPECCFRFDGRDGWCEPARPLYRVPQRRVSRRSKSMVGVHRQPKGPRMMRKTSLILLGAAAGAALTVFVTQTPLMAVGSSAKAAAADTYRQLNLFGDIFERVRSHYVERPDDSKLV